jgi:hypothetical protein
LGQKELSTKGKKHTPEQIIGKLLEADAELNGGATIAEACQKLAISEQTFHRWRNEYGGMKADAVAVSAVYPPFRLHTFQRSYDRGDGVRIKNIEYR